MKIEIEKCIYCGKKSLKSFFKRIDGKDVLASANTPVLDSYCGIHRAEAPANFTFASHQAFFVGILPNIKEYIPYYNRFRKQLLGLVGVGEGQVSKSSLKKIESNWNIIRGLKSEGYQTVGALAFDVIQAGRDFLWVVNLDMTAEVN